MLKYYLAARLVQKFINYERMTRDIFLKIASDAGFDTDQSRMLWESFDTTSAPHIKFLISLIERQYFVNWAAFKKKIREQERSARKIRSDIIHAKKHTAAENSIQR